MSVRGQIRGQERNRQPVSIDIATTLKIHFHLHLITICAATSPYPTFPGLPQSHAGFPVPPAAYFSLWATKQQFGGDNDFVPLLAMPPQPLLHPYTSCLTFPTSLAVLILHSALVEGLSPLLSSLPSMPTLLQVTSLLCSCLLCQAFTQKQLPERVSLSPLSEMYTTLAPPCFLSVTGILHDLIYTQITHLVPAARTRF